MAGLNDNKMGQYQGQWQKKGNIQPEQVIDD
jgi:hypothetical protein